jgi:hypothetical protein
MKGTGRPALERIIDGPGEKGRENLAIVGRSIGFINAAEDLAPLLANLIRGGPSPLFLLDGEISHAINELFVHGKAPRAKHLGQFFHHHVDAFRANMWGGIVMAHHEISDSLTSHLGV